MYIQAPVLLESSLVTKQLFSQEWDQRPRRGRQWGRVIDDLFVSLGLDKAKWLGGERVH